MLFAVSISLDSRDIAYFDLQVFRDVVKMAPERTHNETSPLLGNSNGTASNGAITHRDEEQPADIVQSTDEQAKDPFPDAGKQLRYILPAISIGVCNFQFRRTLHKT